MAVEEHDVTQLLREWSDGNPQALSELLPIIYGELRRVAHQYLRREGAEQTLQTTALVHEAYLKLIDQRSVNWQNRAHFFCDCGASDAPHTHRQCAEAQGRQAPG